MRRSVPCQTAGRVGRPGVVTGSAADLRVSTSIPSLFPLRLRQTTFPPCCHGFADFVSSDGDRIVENWVAVIVSCMPAFATFCRSYVTESRLFRSLRSSFWSWTGHFSSTASKQQLAEQDAANGGSHGSLKPRGSTTTGPYYRLEERTATSSAGSGTAQDFQSSSLV